MQGEVRIKITQTSTQGDNKTAINSKTAEVKNTTDEAKVSDNKTIVASALVANIARNVASQAKNEALYDLNKYFSLTDDFEGKRDLNIAMSIASQAISLGASIWAGAKLGAGLGSLSGPIGTAIGAVTGAALSIGGTAISAYQRYNQQDIEIAQINKQLAYTRQRVGYSLISGSVGENK